MFESGRGAYEARTLSRSLVDGWSKWLATSFDVRFLKVVGGDWRDRNSLTLSHFRSFSAQFKFETPRRLGSSLNYLVLFGRVRL